jgi:hypothetical protein
MFGMSSKRTIYTKYREKMRKLVNAIDVLDIFSDQDLDTYSNYFSKTLEKETFFPLYRYAPLYYKDEFSLPLDFLYLSCNGKLNDVFEGLPVNWNDIYSNDEYLQMVKNLCHMKCFTETFTNNLMWAHYADEFKGVCVEYDLKKLQDKELQAKFFPVYYSKERKIWIDKDLLVNYWAGYIDDDVITDTKGIFLQKADYWKYEREWRICQSNRDPQNMQAIRVDFPCVSAIYLGPRVAKNDISNINETIKNYEVKYGQTVRMYQMVFDDYTYDLHPQEIVRNKDREEIENV